MSLVGAAVKRKEDPNLLVGRGRFVDDIKLPGALFMTFVRSTEAHARILSIDTNEATAMPGVVAIYTIDDFADLPTIPGLPPEVAPLHRPVLAKGTVRFVGDPVAVVVAEDRYQAADAAEAVLVDYDPLPVLPSIDTSLAAMADPEGTRIYPDLQTNALPIFPEEPPAPELLNAPMRLAQTFINNRCSAVPIEPLAVIADWAPSGLTVHATFQAPHHLRNQLTLFFGIPQHECRVIAPDVGGGFGSKICFYPEFFLAPAISRKLGRPVKAAQTRTEAMLHMHHGRAQRNDVEVGFDATGKVHALRVHTYQDVGSYPDPTGMGLGVLTSWMSCGVYAIPVAQTALTNVITNTTPVAAYRGAGRPEASFLIERTMDMIADELGLDPAAVRYTNFIQADQFPYPAATNPEAVFYDSGNYPAALDELKRMMGYDALLAEQTARNADPSQPLMGIGLSCWLEIAGFGPNGSLEGFGHLGSWESAQIRIQPDGTAIVSAGTSPHGQGNATAFAQIAGDAMGIDFDAIHVRFGDTETQQQGIGTMGSRAIAVCGDAIKKASVQIRERAVQIAAHMLEAAPEDIEVSADGFAVRGTPAVTKSWADVATAAFQPLQLPEGMGAGTLDATVFNEVPNFSFPSGAYGCIVGIDRVTGDVNIERYVVVDDCGTVINPLLAEGQVHGGVAQGISQALYEHFTYDENGQPQTSTLVDYLVPAASDLPSYESGRIVTPTPVNSLGAKGIGESGAVGAPPAVVNAVVDALSGFGVRHMDMPCTPEKVWHAMGQPTGSN